MSRIQDVVLNWDRVAQPIQLSTLSRGLDHVLSHQVASQVRELAVDLFNQHGMLEESRFLTDLLRDAFGEVPRVAEMTSEDAQTLQEIARNREAAQQQWAQEISYSDYVGTSVKTLFQISPQGIDWQGTRWPFESINRIMWGGFMGQPGEEPQYLITFGNEDVSTTVTTHDQSAYSAITQKLWVAVGKRLLVELVTELGKGKRIAFGDAIVDDQGIELVRRNQWAASSQWGFQYQNQGMSNSRVLVIWSHVHLESINGVLRLSHKQEPATCVELPYLSVANAHILKIAIQNLLEMKSPVLMSDLLRQ